MSNYPYDINGFYMAPTEPTREMANIIFESLDSLDAFARLLTKKEADALYNHLNSLGSRVQSNALRDWEKSKKS
jgi:hypothetical protein